MFVLGYPGAFINPQEQATPIRQPICRMNEWR
jgi:hypothetical protein